MQKPKEQASTDALPRERLLNHGAGALSDIELLAVFMGTGCKGMHVLENARTLIVEHGPLRRLLDMDPASLMKLPGIGVARFCKLQAALELANRYLRSELEKGEAFCDPGAAGRYFQQHLRGRPSETFAVLFLDTRNRMLGYEELFTGTIDAAAVYPREVVRRALLHNAAAVIVSHNHPSGHAEPSRADREITRELAAALALVGVRLLDHIVVGEGEPVSMAARGWVGG
jgi:DNA repair protein RadC